MPDNAESDGKSWSCLLCPWEHRAHPTFGWTQRDVRAVEVHETMLCPAVTSSD